MKKLLLILCLLSTGTWAASGDALSGSSCGQEADWASCGNTYASDDAYAANIGTNLHYFVDSSFGAGVPAGATIDTILVIIECKAAAVAARDRKWGFQLMIEGSPAGDHVYQELSETENIDTIRGTTNGLWGLTPSVAEINNGTTGIKVLKGSNKTNNFSADHVQLVVYYTEAASTGQVIPIIMGGT